MLYLGIALIAIGVILLVATQVILRRLINTYRKTWEKHDEM